MLYNSLDDRQLTALAAAGDENAFEMLMLRWKRAVTASAYSAVRNRVIAEDAAQNAFMTAWMKLGTLRDGGKFGAWVCRIAKNSARAEAMRFGGCVSYELLENVCAEYSEYCEEQVFPSDSGELYAAISGLSAKLGETVRMRYLDGMSVARIAEKLELPEGTVKRRLHDGRERLGKELGIMDDMKMIQEVSEKLSAMKKWKRVYPRDGFEKVYNETLAAAEAMPESEKKYYLLADIMRYGYWWIKDKQNEEFRQKTLEAAEKGGNREVAVELMKEEANKFSGEEKIAYMRDTLIPRFESMGEKEAVAYEWFWIGHCLRKKGKSKEGIEAIERAHSMLRPSQLYFAVSEAALDMEKAEDSLAGVNDSSYFLSIGGENYYKENGRLNFDCQNGYSNGCINLGEGDRCFSVFYNSSRCGGVFFDDSLHTGESILSPHGASSLTFTSDNIAANGYEGCELWTTVDKGSVINAYYKRGVGIVYISITAKSGEKNWCALKSCSVGGGGNERVPFAPGNRWEYTSNLDPENFELSNIYECVSYDGAAAYIKSGLLARRLRYDQNCWKEAVSELVSEYFVTDDEESGEGHIADMSKVVERMTALALSPWEKAYTSEAADVIRRIMEGDDTCNPGGKVRGCWNFLDVYTLKQSEKTTSLESTDRTMSFEAKDMAGTGDEGYPMLGNMIYDILNDAVGCLWCEDWKPGWSGVMKGDVWNKTESKAEVSDAGIIETPAGRFEGCIKVSLDITGGWDYRQGKKDYYFAPGIGIVRCVHHFKEGKIDAVYDLTEYAGKGEGFIPLYSGITRRYDAAGMKGGYEGWTKYTVIERGGQPMLICNQAGYKIK